MQEQNAKTSRNQSSQPARLLAVKRTPILFVCVLVAFFAFFARFSSYNYTAVDGGLGCLDVFFAGQPFIHGNNHMFYPLHIYAFNKALAACGVSPYTAADYFHNSIYLNAAAGALALGFLFLIMLNLAISEKFALLGILLLGFSDSFSVNATNPNEPMVGFCLSVVAVWLSQLAAGRRSFFLSWLSGGLFAYAMATYQSMIFWLPPIIAAYVFKFFQEKEHRLSCFMLSGTIICAFFTSTILIYRTAYESFYHISNLSQCLIRFLQSDGSGHGFWGRFYVSNLPMLFPGLVQAFFHLPFTGIRQTFLNPSSAKLWILPFAGTSLLCLMLALVIIRLVKRRDASRFLWFAILLFVIIPAVCPFYWLVTYSKLWLQPLAAFTVLIAFSLSVLSKVVANDLQRQWIIAFVIAFAAAMPAWNATTALMPNHRGNTQVDTIVQQIDMNLEDNALIFTNWDTVGVTFTHIYPRSREIISLPALVIEAHPAGMQKIVDEKIQQAARTGRHVYFLGILDTARPDFDAFYQKFLGVDYDALQKYRRASIPFLNLQAGGEQAKVYLLDAKALNSK